MLLLSDFGDCSQMVLTIKDIFVSDNSNTELLQLGVYCQKTTGAVTHRLVWPEEVLTAVFSFFFSRLCPVLVSGCRLWWRMEVLWVNIRATWSAVSLLQIVPGTDENTSEDQSVWSEAIPDTHTHTPLKPVVQFCISGCRWFIEVLYNFTVNIQFVKFGLVYWGNLSSVERKYFCVVSFATTI